MCCCLLFVVVCSRVLLFLRFVAVYGCLWCLLLRVVDCCCSLSLAVVRRRSSLFVYCSLLCVAVRCCLVLFVVVCGCYGLV